jgi:hypothetical protein
MEYRFIDQWAAPFLFAFIVLGGTYLLVVAFGSKLTGRDKKDLKKLFLAAILMIILMMFFAESIW